MLLRFIFSNFRSFRGAQNLSLAASTLSASENRTFHPSGIKEGVLPVIAMYGANASGKTNVLRALEFMSTAVRDSHARWKPDASIPLQPFGTSRCESAPSTFIADFLLDNVRYQYGFVANPEAVSEEWLFAYPKGKKQARFSRDKGTPISFSSTMPGENKTIEGLTRRNSLFLSAAAQNNHEALLPIYRWFARSLSFVIGERRMQTRSLWERKDALTRLLRLADLGITNLLLKEEDLKKVSVGGGFVNALRVSAPQLHLVHRLGDSETTFGQEQESHGTLAFLALLGRIIPAVEQGGVICVDELEASLHPLLAIQLIRLFSKAGPNKPAAQLIFNTQDTNLLSAEVLRRDEIWFTEKKPDGTSQLYPLTDFKPRKEENLERGYLQGRYGAIPFLNPDCLAPFETEDAKT